jgi:hypothetical protein
MAGGDIDSLQSIELTIFFIFNFEYLPVFTFSQLFKDLVVPQTAAVSHMVSHIFLFYLS